MALGDVLAFTDPQAYQAAVRPAHVEILVTAKGDFQAQLTRLELSRLWVQRGCENLPRVVYSEARVDRPPIFFLTRVDQASIRLGGKEVSFGEIVVRGSGSARHHKSEGPCDWSTLSLTQDDLATAAHALVGSDLILRSTTQYLRPSSLAMSRLLKLQERAEQLACEPSRILERPEAARALENALVHATVMCLSERASIKINFGAHRHAAIIARFEEMLAANYDHPLHIAEICAATGATERVLRTSCIEHVGMGPIRYLWLRRMHLTHRALIQSTPETATVTEVATSNGFFELGRFAGEYRALFGESPSATLRHPAKEVRKFRGNPFAFGDSEYVQTGCDT
jgi:AraC-like DNA-binding protein